MSAPAGLQEEIDRHVAGPPTLHGLHRDHGALREALALGTSGGKRFRPWLLGATHDAVAVRPAAGDVVAAVAAAMELLHSAFVIHDDVIDGDDVRRGRPSVPGWFLADATAEGAAPPAARGYARAGAILAGDLALAAAVRAVATCGAPPATTGRLLDLVDATLHATASGELADVRFSVGTEMPSLEEAVTMVEQKTAVYSFVLPMQAGAILGGASEALVGELAEIGRCLGIAYQLYDDVQGVFGDADSTGKDALGDLREGKRTPLVVHAARTAYWPRIAPHLGDPAISDTEAARVRNLLELAGSRGFVEQLATDHLTRCRARAAALGLGEALLDPLLSRWPGADLEPLDAGAALAEGVA